MTNNISEYSAGLAFPEYVTTSYDNSLETALLLKKQNQYDQTLARLDNLQASALNISMINAKGKEKLDGYNKELDELLSQDLGDLTDPKTQARVAGYFTKIATDEDLKQRSRLSQHYLNQDAMIERMRSSKDPTKSGYNKINEFVYKNWEGGENDFVMADDITNWDQKKVAYTPFKDIDQKLVNLTKLLHEETKAKVVSDGNGRLITMKEQGVTKDRISQLLQQTLDADEIAQLQVLSQYRVLSTPSEELYGSYKGFIDRELSINNERLAYFRGMIAEYDPSKVPSTLSEAEKKIKTEEYKAKQDYFRQAEQQLIESSKALNLANLTPDEWAKKGKNELLPYVQQMTVETKINGIADALKYMNEVQAVTADQALFEAAKLQLHKDALELKDKWEMANLQYKYDALAQKDKEKGDKDTPTISNAADQTVNPAQAASRFGDMMTESANLLANSTNIFKNEDLFKTDKDLSKLSQADFRSKHEGNLYLKLWDFYALENGSQNLTLAGFEAFTQKVEAGDYYNDPSVQAIKDQIDTDQMIGNWQKDKVEEIQKMSGYQDPLKVSLSDGTTLEDYAKNWGGWDGKGEATFAVKNSDGDYERITYTQLVEDVKSNPSNQISSTLLMSPSGIGDLRNQTPVSKYIISPALQELVNKSISLTEQNNNMLVKVFNDSLPTFAQTGQRSIDVQLTDANKKLASTTFAPKINAAYKLADGSAFNIQGSDIAQINYDHTGMSDAATFTLSKSGLERLQGTVLIGPSGEKIAISKDMVGATEFKFNHQEPVQYDFKFNQMFKDLTNQRKPLVTAHRGHKIEMQGIPGENIVQITIYNPDGSLAGRQKGPTQGDAATMIALTKRSIDATLAAKK
jgi:hypothetical protein